MIILRYEYNGVNGLKPIYDNGIEFLGSRKEYNNALANYNKFNNHVLRGIYNKPESTRIAISMDDLKKIKDANAEALKIIFERTQEELNIQEEEMKKKQ